MKKLKIISSLPKIFAAHLLVLVTILSSGSKINAEGAPCVYEESSTPYDAALQLAEGSYDIYTKLNKTDQKSIIKSEVQTVDGQGCVAVGSVGANDTAWSKLGSLTSQDSANIYLLRAYLEDSTSSQDASAPSLLVVPKNQPPCADPNDCKYTFEGREYEIQPRQLSNSSDTLRVAMYVPIISAKVKNARFYVDGKTVYTSKGNYVFDTRRVSPGKHTLTTQLILKDGQALILEENKDIPATLVQYVSSFILRYWTTIKIATYVLAFFIVYFLLFALLKHVVRRRRWRTLHFNNAELSRNEPINYAQAVKADDNRRDLRQMIVITLVPMSLLMLFFISNNWIITRFLVDGVSMETTLNNQSNQWLLKFPVSLASVNSGAYIPKKGDVVVFKKDEDNLFEQISEHEDSFVVKRVLGLPGDRVQILNGVFKIYNTEFPLGYDPDAGQSWQGVITPSEGIFIDIVLKEGEVFLVGDNRADSIDSRFYGPVTVDKIVGRVLYSQSEQKQPFNN